MKNIFCTTQIVIATILGIVSFFSCANAQTPKDVPILYGPEWNFHAAGMHEGGNSIYPVIDEYRGKLLEKIQDECQQKNACTIDMKTGRVTYPDGYWYQVETDIGTIEVIGKPATLADFKSRREQLQNDLFQAVAEVGMSANHAGHIHFGIQSAFGDHAHEFRNFFVDWVNHPELGTRILGGLNFNSPPIAMLSAKQRLAFQNVIKEFDEGKIKGIYQLADNIQSRVYYRDISNSKRGYKYQELNVSTIVNNPQNPEKWTLELRPMQMVKDTQEHELYLNLVQRRIEYIKNLKEPVKLLNQNLASSDEDAQKRFYRYVQETPGLNWEEYKKVALRDGGKLKFDPEKVNLTETTKAKSIFCFPQLLSNMFLRAEIRN